MAANHSPGGLPGGGGSNKKKEKRPKLKMSANHLLNFSLPERNSSQNDYSSGSMSHGGKGKGHAKQMHKRTREEYVQANFRFVILEQASKTYLPSLFDPDILVDWDTVEQVYVRTSAENYCCPICLDTPVAPKITQCGHVFCWTCILQYLSYGEKYWKRCPMCFEPVLRPKLRSVCMQPFKFRPKVDSTIEFQLVHRAKGSSFPFMVCTQNDQNPSRSMMTMNHGIIMPSVEDVNASYSRLVKCSTQYLEDLIKSELAILDQIIAKAQLEGDGTLIPFALEGQQVARDRLVNLFNQNVGDAIEAGTAVHAALGTHTHVVQTQAQEQSEMEGPGDSYRFYQSSGGELIFLNPFNMKCLMKEHGDEFHLPERITGKVLDVESFVMDETRRKRHRFLSHLSMYSTIAFCEIEISGQLSKETKAFFKAEFKKRQTSRRNRQQLEDSLSKAHVKSPLVNWSSGSSIPAATEFSLQEAFDVHGSSDAPVPDMNAAAESQVKNDDAIFSFAKITLENGYYPCLSKDEAGKVVPTNGSAAASSGINRMTSNAWGVTRANLEPSTAALSTDASVAHPPTSTGKSKKFKKTSGVSLLSNVPQRSYR